MDKKAILRKSLSLHKGIVLLTILLLATLLTGAFISYTLSNSIPQMIEKQKNTNIGARILFITPDDLTWEQGEIEQLNQREHIELIFSQEEGYWGNRVDTAEGAINASFLGSVNSMLPQDIILGKSQNLEYYEVLISSKVVFPDGSTADGIDFIGQTCSTSAPCPTYIDAQHHIDESKTTYHTIEFNIVGVYDVTKQVHDENQFFTTMETVKHLSHITNGNLYDFMEPNQTMMLLTDTYTHAQQLGLQLKTEGYDIGMGLIFDYALLYGIQYLSAAISILTIVLSCCIVFFLLRRNIRKKYTDIGLLKIIGYQDKQILKLVAEQCFILFFIAGILAIGGYGSLYPHINNALFAAVYLPIFSTRFLFAAIVFLFVIPGVTLLLLSKQLKKISPIVMLKEEDV